MGVSAAGGEVGAHTRVCGGAAPHAVLAAPARRRGGGALAAIAAPRAAGPEGVGGAGGQRAPQAQRRLAAGRHSEIIIEYNKYKHKKMHIIILAVFIKWTDT